MNVRINSYVSIVGIPEAGTGVVDGAFEGDMILVRFTPTELSQGKALTKSGHQCVNPRGIYSRLYLFKENELLLVDEDNNGRRSKNKITKSVRAKAHKQSKETT